MRLTLGLGLAFGVAIAVLATAIFLIRNAARFTRIDVPDARRLHQNPTPRGGGLAMPFAVTGAAIALLLLLDPSRRDLWVAVAGYALPNGILGVIDDYRPIRSRTKFAIQIGLAIAFVVFGARVSVLVIPPFGTVSLGPVAAPFTVLFLVWSTNVYNFMDGMDALAAGSGVAFFATLAALAFLATSSDPAAGWIAVFGAAACLGFLTVNTPPARIFMGDGGALYVGALLGALAVVVTRPDAAAVPFASAVLAMGAFIWDATYTLVMRIVRRESWHLPHKRHLFQRLVTAGWTHGRVRALYAVLALVSSATALGIALGPAPIRRTSVAIALAAFIGVSILTERTERRHRQRTPEQAQ